MVETLGLQERLMRVFGGREVPNMRGAPINCYDRPVGILLACQPSWGGNPKREPPLRRTRSAILTVKKGWHIPQVAPSVVRLIAIDVIDHMLGHGASHDDESNSMCERSEQLNVSVFFTEAAGLAPCALRIPYRAGAGATQIRSGVPDEYARCRIVRHTRDDKLLSKMLKGHEEPPF